MTDTSPKTPKLPLNELRRNDGLEQQSPDRTIPQHLAPHFHQDGNAYRSAHRPDKIDFVDRGTRMHAYRPVSAFTARAMAEIVDSRGWKSLAITGDKDWRSKAYVELASRGIEVSGYQPTEKDREVLGRRQERKAALQNPKVQAFVTATDAQQRQAAVAKYPDLKDAFAVREAINKMGEQMSDAKGRATWVGLMTDRVVLAVHRGEALPEVKVKAPVQQRDDRSQDGQER